MLPAVPRTVRLMPRARAVAPNRRVLIVPRDFILDWRWRSGSTWVWNEGAAEWAEAVAVFSIVWLKVVYILVVVVVDRALLWVSN